MELDQYAKETAETLAAGMAQATEWANELQEMFTTASGDLFQDFDPLNLESLRNINMENMEELWHQVSHSGLPDRQAIAILLEDLYRFASEMGILTVLITICFAAYFARRWQIRRVRFYYQPSSEKYKNLFKNTDLASMRYKPWLFTLNNHVQGIFFCFVESLMSYFTTIKYAREIFELSDGGEIALDWITHPADQQLALGGDGQNHAKTKRPIVVVVPGINGDSTKLYATSMANACIAQNLDMVVVNWRGMGGVPLKTAKIYNGCDTDHLEEVIESLYTELCLDDQGRQVRRMTGIGLSLGASVLGIYAARMGEKTRLDACVGVGCHFKNDIAQPFIKTAMFGVYDWAICQSFKAYGQEMVNQFDALVVKKHPERVLGDSPTKITFATEMTKLFAKAAGFKNVKDYDHECDVAHRMHQIKVPFFFLSSLDDPFFGPNCIPIADCHDNILLGVTKTGGHICYMEGGKGGILPVGQWWTKPSLVFMEHFMKEASRQDYDEAKKTFKRVPSNQALLTQMTSQITSSDDTQSEIEMSSTRVQ